MENASTGFVTFYENAIAIIQDCSEKIENFSGDLMGAMDFLISVRNEMMEEIEDQKEVYFLGDVDDAEAKQIIASVVEIEETTLRSINHD